MKDILLDWFMTFWKVLVLPLPKTFLAEAKKAHGKAASAIIWLVLFGIYIYLLASYRVAPFSFSALLTAMIVIPVAVILMTSAMHFVYQRLAHRKDYLYDEMLYLTTAIVLTFQVIVLIVLMFTPETVSRLVEYLVIMYQIALITMAVKSVAKIEYWQAFVCVFFSVLTALAVALLVIFLVYSVVAPPGTVR